MTGGRRAPGSASKSTERVAGQLTEACGRRQPPMATLSIRWEPSPSVKFTCSGALPKQSRPARPCWQIVGIARSFVCFHARDVFCRQSARCRKRCGPHSGGGGRGKSGPRSCTRPLARTALRCASLVGSHSVSVRGSLNCLVRRLSKRRSCPTETTSAKISGKFPSRANVGTLRCLLCLRIIHQREP